MAAQKKYTPRTLDKAVRKYFASISRQKVLKEMVPTGRLDKYGHPEMEQQTILNGLGEPITVTEFLVPPDVGGLCTYLGIHRSTWNDYANDPEKADTVTYARGVMRAWNERELLIREGKNTRAIEFNLIHNYGYGQIQSGGNAGKTLEEYLQELSQNGEGGQEF